MEIILLTEFVLTFGDIQLTPQRPFFGNLTRLRNDVILLRDRQGFWRNQLTELRSTNVEAWVKRKLQTATKIAYLNRRLCALTDGNEGCQTITIQTLPSLLIMTRYEDFQSSCRSGTMCHHRSLLVSIQVFNRGLSRSILPIRTHSDI